MNALITELLSANFQVILTGAPGTGKTFTAKEIAKAMVGAKISEDATEEEKKVARAIEESRIASVQFHPGYDYSDFVIGMKPVLLTEEGKEVEKKDGEYVLAESKTKVNKLGNAQVSFRWKDGIFKKFADDAKKVYDTATKEGEEAPKFVFLIDEINRADLSRVFGELFSLMEEEYRYPNEKGTGVTLPNGDYFVIPKNLYIIGTMNDIDRSVESMDFAMRRRFAWLEVKPEDTADAILSRVPQKNTLIAKMKAVNDLIRSEDFRLGSEYQLGGAIFAKFKKYYGEENAFDSLWDYHIINIIMEYLRGRSDKKEVLEKLKSVYDAAVGEDEEDGQQNEVDNRSPFRITFPDREEIIATKRKGDGLSAFVKFIRYVYEKQGDEGFGRISDSVFRGRMPLILREVPQNQARYYRGIPDLNNYYLHTYSSNSEKIDMINKISEVLHLDVRAERTNE